MAKGRKKRGDESAPKAGPGFSNRPFKALKAVRPDAERKPAPTPVPAPVPAAPDDDERALLAAFAGASPLDRRDIALRDPEARPIPAAADDAAAVMRQLDDLVRGDVAFDFADTEEYIEAKVAGLDRNVVRKLRRGEFSVQAHLDLHGLTRDEAREKVDAFIRGMHAEGKRCVLIVHGRGLRSKDNVPVLKTKLAAWLTRGAMGRRVLAYASARPSDGGTGAVYVLLRG
ncbi:MAG: Smr/MutS family protein [Deltaproteobacteria bacterium]|nr:Smr/MutS family protein [Deltaproteobacteria bacterium]